LTEANNAIPSDGVSLTATVIVRFRLQRDAVPVLHQAIGPNYVQVLVQPGIGSLTGQVIAEYTAEQAYSTWRQGIAAQVAAINRKTEQYHIAEEYKFRVEREKRESERKKIEAEGIR